MIKHKDLSPFQVGKLHERFPNYEQVTEGNLEAGDLLILTRTGDYTLVDASPVSERNVGAKIGDMPVLRRSCKAETWYWLSNVERRVLLDFNDEAETIINEKFRPDELLHTNRRVIPSSGKAWLPDKHIIVRDRANELVEVRHPLNPDFTKMDYRMCVVFKERKPYGLHQTWRDMVASCMTPSLLKALKWVIYDVSCNGTQHIYLECDLPGVANNRGVLLYVPTSYFHQKDWSIVEKFHTDVAVGYYVNGNFGSTQDMAAGWAELTRAALTSLEAKVLRAIVENKL